MLNRLKVYFVKVTVEKNVPFYTHVDCKNYGRRIALLSKPRHALKALPCYSSLMRL